MFIGWGGGCGSIYSPFIGNENDFEIILCSRGSLNSPGSLYTTNTIIITEWEWQVGKEWNLPTKCLYIIEKNWKESPCATLHLSWIIIRYTTMLYLWVHTGRNIIKMQSLIVMYTPFFKCSRNVLTNIILFFILFLSGNLFGKTFVYVLYGTCEKRGPSVRYVHYSYRDREGRLENNGQTLSQCLLEFSLWIFILAHRVRCVFLPFLLYFKRKIAIFEIIKLNDYRLSRDNFFLLLFPGFFRRI